MRDDDDVGAAVCVSRVTFVVAPLALPIREDPLPPTAPAVVAVVVAVVVALVLVLVLVALEVEVGPPKEDEEAAAAKLGAALTALWACRSWRLRSRAALPSRGVVGAAVW